MTAVCWLQRVVSGKYPASTREKNTKQRRLHRGFWGGDVPKLMENMGECLLFLGNYFLNEEIGGPDPNKHFLLEDDVGRKHDLDIIRWDLIQMQTWRFQSVLDAEVFLANSWLATFVGFQPRSLTRCFSNHRGKQKLSRKDNDLRVRRCQSWIIYFRQT